MSLHGFTGLVIGPDHPGYDDARAVFNGMIDRRPLAIYRCTTADDVVAVVNHARDEGLALAVYGGGHSVTGAAVVDGGVVCDMRGLKGIDIDPSTRTVRAEAGSRGVSSTLRRRPTGWRSPADASPRLVSQDSRSGAAAAGSNGDAGSRATT
jgi:FAD/FMN-containing dehydrogenase